MNGGAIVLFLISFAICISIIYDTSFKLDYLIQNPTAFTYTTCIFTKTEVYKKQKSTFRELHFIYSTNGTDSWIKQGFYKRKKSQINWSSKHKPGDIGTCVRSFFPKTKRAPNPYHDTFTINNFMTHQDITAMWLAIDNKSGRITTIIYFSVLLLFFMCALCGLYSGAMNDMVDEGDDCSVGIMLIGLWIIAASVVGIPYIIFGAIKEHALNGPLGKTINVNEVYKDVEGGCTIEGVLKTINLYREYGVETIEDVEDNFFNFTVVEYGVETIEDNFLAIATSRGTTAEYLNIGTTYNCFQNIFTKQVILNEYPTVKWLEPPYSATDELALGIVFLLLPCLCVCILVGAANKN